MNDTVFDADAFMQTTVDSPMATQMQTIPDGEYVAMLGDFDSSALKTVNTQKGERKVLEVPFIIQDDGTLAAKLGPRDQYLHRESFWLDFNTTGQLDTGPDKNVRLGQLRQALDQNVPGWSPLHLRGMGPLRIVIKTTPDKNDPEKKYTNITKYAKIS